MATETRETVDRIGSDKVEGTAVYDAHWDWEDFERRRMVADYYHTPRIEH